LVVYIKEPSNSCIAKLSAQAWKEAICKTSYRTTRHRTPQLAPDGQQCYMQHPPVQKTWDSFTPFWVSF
jgi:hypothetical protein